MHVKPSTASTAAAVGYYILLNVWLYLIAHAEDEAAEAIVRTQKRELLRDMDYATHAALRAFTAWHSVDLKEWRAELARDLEELEDDGRTAMGNTPTCEGCGEAEDHCMCDGEWAPGLAAWKGEA